MEDLSYPFPYLSCHFSSSSILYCFVSVSQSRTRCLSVSGGTLDVILTLIAVQILSGTALVMVSFFLSLSLQYISYCLLLPDGLMFTGRQMCGLWAALHTLIPVSMYLLVLILRCNLSVKLGKLLEVGYDCSYSTSKLGCNT